MTELLSAPSPTNTETEPLRVAIIGTGMISELHRRGAAMAGADLVGVLGRKTDATREVARRWNAQRAYTDLDDLLSSDAEIVHIATPNTTHASYSRAAIEAGKHVICEKPLGVSAPEAIELAQLARERGVVATVPFVYRYHPLVREIRARVLAGALGRVNVIHGSYLQDWMLSPSTGGWRVRPEHGGPSRAFADIGSHWCDLLEWVTGERFVELSASTHTAYPQRPGVDGQLEDVVTEDTASVQLRTDRGTPTSMLVSQVSAGRKNRLWFEVDGADQSAVFDQENPEQVWLGGPGGAQLVVRDPGHGSAEQRRLSTLPPGHVQGFALCFESFVADTYAAVRGGTPEGLPTFADGARSALIVDAVLASAARRGWVDIAELAD